jgi:hypothetical protein
MLVPRLTEAFVAYILCSCIVSQLVFSCGGSIFPGGNGSMMIEAVPFFHILVNTIETVVGDDVSRNPVTFLVGS